MKSLELTRQSVNLTIQVTRQDGNRIDVYLLPLISLTWLVMVLWRGMIAFNALRFTLTVWWLDTRAGIEIVGKLAAIGYQALCFGLGVRFL